MNTPVIKERGQGTIVIIPVAVVAMAVVILVVYALMHIHGPTQRGKTKK
jgi:hypothetical protein